MDRIVADVASKSKLPLELAEATIDRGEAIVVELQRRECLRIHGGEVGDNAAKLIVTHVPAKVRAEECEGGESGEQTDAREGHERSAAHRGRKQGCGAAQREDEARGGVARRTSFEGS